MPKEVYLDHHTITRPSPKVIEKLNFFFREKWGTAFAPHQKGQELYPEIDEALKKLYTHLGASDSHHFILTYGGQDAIFQLFMDFYFEEVQETGKNHFLTLSNEEALILLSLSRLDELGCVTKLLPVDENGRILLDALDEALKPKTALFSFSWANPLTGVIQPVEEIVSRCHAKGVAVHVNASAVMGKIPFLFADSKIDFLTFDGDKIHMPQGIGGRLQKKKPKHSSHNIAALSALALAVEESALRQEQFSLEAARLRDTFESELKLALPSAEILFQNVERLPHISCIAFPGVMSEALLFALHRRGVYASLGGGQYQKLSSQLKNPCALSFAISHETTEDELAHALDVIVSSVRKLSTLSQSL